MTGNSHTVNLLLLGVICTFSFLLFLERVDPNLMEARNLVAAREIVESSDWLIPTMNGELRLAKPPFPTWLAAAMRMQAADPNSLAALRLPNALVSSLMIFFLYGLAWTMSRDRRTAFYSAAISATTYLVILVGRTASWDVFCHAFMAGGLWALYNGLQRQNGSRRAPLLLAGLCLGLSAMSKGPVAFYALLLPFLISYSVVYRGDGFKKNWPWLLAALVLCLVLALWWPALVYFKHPEAWNHVAHKETTAWVNRHLKPFWYYLRMPVFSGGWLVLFLAGLVWPYAGKRVQSARDYRFLVIWLLASVVLLSLIPEKKERYLLPAMLPAVLLAGHLFKGICDTWDQDRAGRGDRLVVLLHTVLSTLTALALPVALVVLLKDKVQFARLLPFFAVLWPLAVAFPVLYRQKRLHGLFLATLLLLCTLTLGAMQNYRSLVYTNPDYRTMAKADLDPWPDIPVFQLKGNANMKMVWNLERVIADWDQEMVLSLLAAGQPVAVVSEAEADAVLVERLGEGLDVTVAGIYDYKKSRPKKRKIFLSVVTRPGGAGLGSRQVE